MITRAERQDEQVVLLSADGLPIGTTRKATVHHGATPLHLAFSCYLFDSRGRFLVTRRSLAKRTWPGVWSNSCCGHPAPGEPVEAAVRRRVNDELGMAVDEVVCAVPDFRYRAIDASGVVENEVCPVYVGRVSGEPVVDPTEVADWRWSSWEAFVRIARDAPWAISPWAALQAPLLDAGLGEDPDRSGDRDPGPGAQGEG